jgi:hypothetical protein
MDKLPELVGPFLVVLLFAYPSLYFFGRGLARGPRSRRLANLALFCGLAALIVPEYIVSLVITDHSARLFLYSGVARALIGLVGILLALGAIFTRRDGGVGLARPILGGAFSLLHLIAGAALLVLGYFTGSSTPWVYQSPDGAFRLTLPSQLWKQSPATEKTGVVAFVRPILPRMQAKVLSVKQRQTTLDFERAAEFFRTFVEKDPQRRGRLKFRDGTNAAGNTYSYCTLMESSPDGTAVFSAHSVVWCPNKQLVVEVIFEGLPTMHSQTGKAAEMEAIEKSAETICLSVE